MCCGVSIVPGRRDVTTGMGQLADASALDTARSRLAQTDPKDEPLLAFWRELIPDDFDPSDPRKVISLDFELSGIERGYRSLRRISGLKSVEGKSVLDIGAGNGGLCIACALSGAAATAGIEIEPSRIALARKWADCRGVDVDFRKAVAERLPFDDETFDVVFLSSVIEHVDNQDLTIREMSRVLKRGGAFFLDGPNRLSPHWLLEDPHYRIAGISAMPRRMGEWWVVRVRKVSPSYDVGVFPIFSRLVRNLGRHGLRMIDSDHNSYLLSVLTNPHRVQSASKRAALSAGSMIGLNGVLAALLRNTLPSFSIVGIKDWSHMKGRT